MEELVNPEILPRLEALKAQPKFVNESGTIHNGMRPEHERLTAESLVNGLIDAFIVENSKSGKRGYARRQFAQSLKRFNGHDTEDRERMCRYVEQIAENLGIEKPRRLFTYWLYGPVLGTLLILPRPKPN